MSEEVRYSQFACVQCRNAHRKCDKVLDSCGYCTKTHKPCKYVAPPARKKTKKRTREEVQLDVGDQQQQQQQPPDKKIKQEGDDSEESSFSGPEMNPQAILENIKNFLPNGDLGITECINAYYTLFGTGFQLLEADLGEQVIEKMKEKTTNTPSPSQIDLPSLFLFIATQILSLQRLGKRRLAFKLYTYLQPLLWSEIFTSTSDSTSGHLTKEAFTRLKLITCAIATLSYYASGSVGVDAVRLIVQQGRHFSKILLKYMNNEHYASTQTAIFYTRRLESYMLLSELDLVQHEENVLTYLRALLDTIQNMYLFGQKTALSDIVIDEHSDVLQIVDVSERLTDKALQQSAGFQPPMANAILRLAFHLCHNGVRLTYMMQNEAFESRMISIANLLSDTISNDQQSFLYSPCFSIRPVVNISRIHLKHCKHDKVRLQQDLKAMKVLLERFDVVSDRYLSLITELEHAVLQESQPATEQVSEFLTESDLDYTDLFRSMFDNPFFLLQPELMNLTAEQQPPQPQVLPTPQFGSPNNLRYLHEGTFSGLLHDSIPANVAPRQATSTNPVYYQGYHPHINNNQIAASQPPSDHSSQSGYFNPTLL